MSEKRLIEAKADKAMRLVFLGTPDFALPSLQMLLDESYNVVGVFTQPDKAVGRSKKLQPSAVKKFAEGKGLPVFQVEKIRQEEGSRILHELEPDLMITAAFGQILSAENLNTPRIGCINVHGSLLPKYRGAAPIQWSIIDGDKETGITTMMTDVGLDTGNLLLQRKINIGENETAGELFERMALLGAQTLKETLALLIKGELYHEKQDESLATKCTQLKKEIAEINWRKGAQEIHNLVRGCNPWPCAFTHLGEDTIKIWQTRLLSNYAKTGKPGEIICADKKAGLIIMAGDVALEITELQMPGSKRMDAKAYLNGHSLPLGECFS